MQKLRSGVWCVAGSYLLAMAGGCEQTPAPVAKPAPPVPPPVAVAPAPAPPAEKPSPPVLPPELIAKMDELLKLSKPPAAGGADALDQAVGAIEQQAKVGALAGEVVALVGTLTPEQQTEFSKRYGDQLAAIQKPAALPAVAPPPVTP